MAEEKKNEPGHEFLARLGKTRLRPGGREATEWLLGHVDFTADTRVLEVACNMGTTMVALAETHGCRVTGLDMNPKALEKARANIEKHGIAFEEILEVFDDPAFLTGYDFEHSEIEDRYYGIGNLNGILIVLVFFTEKKERIRLISARQADKELRDEYYDYFKKINS